MIKIKRKKGFVYQARVSLPNGKIETKCFERKKDAEYWQSEIKRKVKLEGLEYINVRPYLQVAEVCSYWFERKILINKAYKTVAAYRGSIENYIKPLLGPEKIGDIQEKHCDFFVKCLIEKKLHPKTINRHLMVLKAIFKFCVSEGWLRINPAAKVAFLHEPDSDFDFLNAEEINKLLNICVENKSLSALLMIALNTGMREGEICGLKWDCVDLSSRLIHIKRIFTDKGLLETTKTKKRRFVPINNVLWSFLKGIVGINQDSDQFVTVSSNSKPWQPSHVSNRVLLPELIKAGVRRVTFHTLRHTFASHFVMNGGSIYDLQKILGHSKIEMTMRYAHLCPSYLAKAANIVSFGKHNESNFPENDHMKLIAKN